MSRDILVQTVCAHLIYVDKKPADAAFAERNKIRRNRLIDVYTAKKSWCSVMLYLLDTYDTSKYWAPPFNNLLKAFLDLFRSLGLDCDYLGSNSAEEDDILLAISALACDLSGYPCKIIVVNGESICLGAKSDGYLNRYIHNANVKEIWDYSKQNVEKFPSICSIPAYYVPITYHPTFERIFKLDLDSPKDIDVCMYGCEGGSAGRRALVKNQLVRKGHKVWLGSTNSNSELERILDRSKLVVIVHYYEKNQAIDYYRLFSLLSCKVLTIHETPSQNQLDDNMNRVIYADYGDIADKCTEYLSMTQTERNAVAEETYKWWKTKSLIDSMPFKTIQKPPV